MSLQCSFPGNCFDSAEYPKRHQFHHSCTGNRSGDFIVAIDEDKPDPRCHKYHYGATYRPVRTMNYRTPYDSESANADSNNDDLENGIGLGYSVERPTMNSRRPRHVPGEKEHPVLFGLLRSVHQQNSKLLAMRIDQLARVFFPLTFLLLSVAYWTYYLNIRAVSEL